MKYRISAENRNNHLLNIEFVVEGLDSEELTVQLPAWRPGRYQIANFAKNILKLKAFDVKGDPLETVKTTKDQWSIKTLNKTSLVIKYIYYANELNAGSTLVNREQIYINGVNCFLYVPGRLDEQCNLLLDIPDDYKVATSLENVGSKEFLAKDFHDLVDSPLVASATLQHDEFECEGVKFHLWFQGNCQPDFAKLKNDFAGIASEQIKVMGDLPVPEYHFITQITPYRFYHGVEHEASTVMALGPGYELMGGRYNDFVGLASHELYHSWNIKAIRPVAMMPYDYSVENYSPLGYVAEGVTSYFGDKFLLRSGVFSLQEFLDEFNRYVLRHFQNYGRFNLSVAESSYDMWLDGYDPGVPHRKTSIYAKGALCALLLDLDIMRKTDGRVSLDDVMKKLYLGFGKTGKGYSEEDYKSIIEELTGISFDNYFRGYIWGTVSLEEGLNEALQYVGLELSRSALIKQHEQNAGLKIAIENYRLFVAATAPGSPAEEAGLEIGDEIVAVNNYKVEPENFDNWFNSSEKRIQLQVFSSGQLRSLPVSIIEGDYYPVYNILPVISPNISQLEAFKHWSYQEFPE